MPSRWCRAARILVARKLSPAKPRAVQGYEPRAGTSRREQDVGQAHTEPPVPANTPQREARTRVPAVGDGGGRDGLADDECVRWQRDLALGGGLERTELLVLSLCARHEAREGRAWRVRHAWFGNVARSVLRVEGAALLRIGKHVDDRAEVVAHRSLALPLLLRAVGLGSRDGLLRRLLGGHRGSLRVP